MNRFKGLDLVDRLPEGLWMEVHNIVHEAVTKTIPKKKKCKKAKWLFEEAFQIAEERRKAKGKGERERTNQVLEFFFRRSLKTGAVNQQKAKKECQINEKSKRRKHWK